MTTWLKTFDATTALANFEAYEKMSTVFVESGAFPKTMNAAKFVVLMQAWFDLWLAPTEAIRSLAIINGNVSMFGAKVIERVRANWYKIELKEELKDEIYEKDWQKFKRMIWYCEATLTKRNNVNDTVQAGEEETWTEKYTMEDAKTAWLLGKDNWKNYPKLMLRYRAIGQAVKFFCPEVLGWVSMYEEMKDHFGEEKTAFVEVPAEEILSDLGIQEPTVIEPVDEKNETSETTEKPIETKAVPVAKTEEKKTDVLKPWDSVEHKLLGKWILKDTFEDQMLVEFEKWGMKEVNKKTIKKA